jgi:uncharacterized protein (DUF2384 family)
MELVREAPSRVDDDPSAISDEGGAAMARASVNLFRKWGLTDAEACTLLGGISPSKYAKWKRGEIGRLGVDLKTRLSLLMGIHKALRILFTENDRAYAWVSTPNSDFEEQRPLDIMLRGSLMDLYAARQYLDAARGW